MKKIILIISVIAVMFILAGCGKATGEAVAFECSSYVDGELVNCVEDLSACADFSRETLEQYGYEHCYEDGILEQCVEQCIEGDSYEPSCVLNCVDAMESMPEEIEVPIDYVSQEPACAPGLTECKESDGSSACWDLTSSDFNCGACGNKCIEGATCIASNCVSGGSGPADDGPEKLGCNENDGGINNYQKGILTTPEGKEFTDFCVESEAFPSVPADGSKLGAIYEYYCFSNIDSSKDNFVDSGTIVSTCKDGCKDGACIIALQGTPGDLSKYPEQFVGEDYGKDGEKLFDGFLVVGAPAPAIDNLAMVDIAENMKYNGKIVYFSYSAKLDSEITYPAGDDNLIIVGSPCVNSVSAEVEGFPADCKNGLKEGKSYIKLMKWPNGNHYLLITGITGESRRVAAKVLAHRSNELSGSEVEISGKDYLTATITKIK